MMMKRMVPLVAIAILLLTLAPTAQAIDCWKCKAFPVQQIKRCVEAFGVRPTFTECYDIGEDDCETDGEECDPGFAAMTPLAAEYRVAAVERLDEPPTNAALIASLEAPAPSHR
jgi:hypothetical protein